jgi:hypothetical protein
MDDIFLPDETEDTPDEAVEFERSEIETEHVAEHVKEGHPSGIDASGYVTLTFGRFVKLVANHSFEEVVDRNQDEDIILSTNLLTDLANSRRFAPNTRGPLMILGGLLFGILLGYFLF